MFEIETFIDAVQNRPILWNKRIKNYHNRALSHREWEGLAKAIGTTSEKARKKWKNLRDTFMKELKKVRKPRPGEKKPKYIGTWPYYDNMLFLRVILKPRKPQDKLIPVDCIKQEAEIAEVAVDDTQQHESNNYEMVEFHDTERKEETNHHRLDDQDGDSDLHWFKSILPYVRQLPPMKKLLFRTYIQERLIHELSESNPE